GVANKGTAAGPVDLDPDTGKVRYFPITDDYRELMEHPHGLYSKGLILDDLFASDRAKINPYATDGQLASRRRATPTCSLGAGGCCEDVDGRDERRPEITDGKSIDDGLKPHALYMGGSYPGWATDEWFRGVENTPQSIEGSELVSEYAIDDVWSAFTFTAEESDMLASVGTDLGKYLDESRSAFITGQLPLSEWDTFVTTLEDIGLSDFMEAQQAAFDRRQ